MENKKNKELEKKIEQNNKDQFICYLAFLIKKYKGEKKK